MSFFEQEQIYNELVEMSELYEEIREVMYGDEYKDKDTKIDCLNKLERLVELQEILYFRAKYSSDTDAIEFVNMLRASAVFLGIPADVDISEIFTEMKESIQYAKEQLDSQP